ncbi:hypothetical protein C8A05DRAFT_14671 [Staphylotrichum tortipilum]|uniref:Uncharacterized protein n=1 Tax=Staphylotrichum tortipilum TaxID=2831512 RepID=A0AAN6RTZ2_9PEZI|nr:hypothetical protein C8A05DRAFT_14671 [Staphylotrichum longicolle]
MSHRSPDVYSRRPTDDDHRGPEPWDRRRETFPRASRGFDHNKDSRHRRDTDMSMRERRNQTWAQHDTTAPANSTKPSGNANSTRPENGSKAKTASRSPANSPAINRDAAYEQLVGLFGKHAEAVANVTRLRAERDPLDKVLKQRQAEYEKSRLKYADFPSVPEVQNMHRLKYADRVRTLDTQIQKAQDEVVLVTESLVRAVLNSAAPQGCEPKPADPAASAQHQETIKNQQAEINGLKTKIRKIETDHSQELSELQAEFNRQHTKMRHDMEETLKGMQKEIKEASGLKNLREEVMGEVKQQLCAMHEEIKTRQQEQDGTCRNDLQSQLSRHERNSPDNVSTAEVSSLVQEENSALQSDISGLLSRVDNLAGQLAQHTQDTAALRDGVTACTQRLEQDAQKLEEHESKLSGLDTEALDRFSETMSIDFPDLQRRVAAMQLKVDSTPQEIDSKQQAMFAQVQNYMDTAGVNLAERVDEIQMSVMQHGKRLGALEEAPASAEKPVSAAPTSQAAGPAFDVMNQDLALIKSEFNSTKAVVDRLQHDCVALTNKDILGQLAAVRHSIMVLDSQFNNLSTRSLAEFIIGHMEHIYPNAQQLTADVKGLKLLTDSLASRIDGVEGRVQDFKGKVDIFTKTRLEAAGMNGGDMDNGGQPGQKRKRVEPGPNGAAAYPLTATAD